MKKILFKQIVIGLSIIAGIVSVLSLGIIFSIQSKAVIQDLEEIVEQVESTYDTSKLDVEEKKRLFQNDYLNRAYAVDFILNQDINQSYTTSELKRIKQLMELESINLIDDEGNIVFSSEEEYVGLNFKDYHEDFPFWELIENKDSNANVVTLDTDTILEQEDPIYIGIKSSSEKYSVVQIEIDSSKLRVLLKASTIGSIVDATPSLYEMAVFVVDRSSGEVEGMTKNNERDLHFENVNTKEAFISVLDSGKDGKLIRINGSMKYLKTKDLGNKILCAYAQMDLVYRTVLIQFVAFLSAFLVIIACIWMMLMYYLKKYILKDLYSIASNIKILIDGNYDITFETIHNTEFKKICEILNDWKDSYKSRAQRMTRIINAINSQAAIFECLYSINQCFFSDNIKDILGVEDDIWNQMKNSPEQFEKYINTLTSSADSEDNIIRVNDRFISIASYHFKDEFYGMILDKTKDVEQKMRIQQDLQEKLQEKQEESETDPLTKLANRAGLEKKVKKALENSPGKGIMIIFDLDNFKTINDTLGHPEGDKVLKKFANCLRSCFRKNDIVARMGGDEFAVFIDMNMTVHEITVKIESILQIIRRELKDYYKRYKLSTSIGVAYVDKVSSNYEDLYKSADVALYVAKKYGKDGFYINDYNISNKKY